MTGKTICVMQPYLFPYLPYYQLAHAVDAFWVLDDVQFIRRGFMNRNTILLNGARHPVTFPVSTGQRGDLIGDKTLPDGFDQSLNKVKQTLNHAYGAAPFGDEVMVLMDQISGQNWTRFLDIAMASLRLSFDRLGLTTPLHLASSLELPDSLSGQDRILAICDHDNATRYINPIGGQTLYAAEAFSARGVELLFLQTTPQPYPQIGVTGFEANLSILDLIAHVSPGDYAGYLESYQVLPAYSV